MRDYFMRTERLGFSVWTGEDASLAQALWGDPEVTRYICASGSFSPQEIQDRLELEIHNGEKYGVQYWPVFLLDTADLVGCCGLRPCPAEPGTYELGFHLRPAYWGMGLAPEAASQVIGYAFSHLKAAKLQAGHNPKNIRSSNVLAKLGFRYVGDHFYPPTGLDHPSYELLPQEASEHP